MATDVKVPALGESITEGTLAQWLKKAGDAVAADEPIASLETDKVTVEVPSPAAGVLSETVVNEGDTVAVGALIARIDEGGAARPLRPRPKRRRSDADQPGGRRRKRRAARRRRRARSPQPSAATATPAMRRPRHHLVAGGAPRGARTSCRPDQHQGHRQGRPPDQGRRACGGAGARKPSAPAQAGQAPAPAPSRTSAAPPPPRPRRQASARKSASRCRGFGRRSPSG